MNRAIAPLSVLLRCDDGRIVYLNGKEVARQNMPPGPVTATTPAAVAIAGANLVAAEVHQASPTSSDLVFDLVFDLELKLYAEGEAPAVDHYAEGTAASAHVPKASPQFQSSALPAIARLRAELDLPATESITLTPENGDRSSETQV